MKRLSLFASVIALGVGTAASILPSRHNFASANLNVAQTTDGAFRDGLYLGKLTAQQGVAPRVPSGRWSTDADRASFTAGYQQGYHEFLANRSTPNQRGRQAE